ncbi:zinc-binding dehydrogenase [Nocardia sp. NPDC058518]|uniref:zinc-binding dehydrogenase n=1 Tax=Nocardia sp. NPDC058518 TaxID=3346534 RepID=UPI003660C51E
MTANFDIPATSRAAVITEFGADLEVRELPIPDLEPGALLVRIEAATVCGSDVHVWDGSLHAGGVRPIVPPVVPGHEMTGVVVSMAGDDIGYTGGGRVAMGDRIVFTQGRCGTCYHCAVAGQPNLCSHRRNYGDNCDNHPYLVGGFAEYCYVYPSSRKIKVPDDVAPEWASAGSCALRTVIAAYERLGRIEPWQTVVIQGPGPLGLFATALAKRSGAARIIVIGAPAARLELAREWGATDLISVDDAPDAETRVSTVRELTGGNGAEIVQEWSGAGSAFAEGLDMVRRGGRFLVGGQVGPHHVTIQPAKIMKNHLDIIGSMSADDSHYWKAMQFLSQAKQEFDFDRLMTTRYGLHDVTAALRGMQNLSEIKPVIDPRLLAS